MSSQEIYCIFYSTVAWEQIKVGDRYERARFFHCYKRGVDRVFIDHPSFLEKVPFPPFGPEGKCSSAFTSFSEVSLLVSGLGKDRREDLRP
jgi:hypothetical protein